MVKADVLLDIFFRDLPFGARVARIAACGYRFVETWGGGKPEDLADIAGAGREHGVSLVSVVLNFATEHEVAPVRAENRARFLARVDRYSDNALAAGCASGIVTSGNLAPELSPAAHRDNLAAALAAAGELAGKKGFCLNLEPLNTLVDHAGYYLDSRETAVGIIREIDQPNVKVLYDLYHMEIMTGNQVEFIVKNIAWLGHFHCAGVPGRHEPFRGETNYPFVLEQLEAAGYQGYFGLEYFPALESGESLRKTLAYLNGKGD